MTSQINDYEYLIVHGSIDLILNGSTDLIVHGSIDLILNGSTDKWF